MEERLISFQFYVYSSPANVRATAYLDNGRLVAVHVSDERHRGAAQDMAEALLRSFLSSNQITPVNESNIPEH